MKKSFGSTVPRSEREDRSAAGQAVAILASDDTAAECTEIRPMRPIPIDRARQARMPHVAPIVEPELAYRIAKQLRSAERAEKRVTRALENAREAMTALSDSVKARVAHLAEHERELAVQHERLEKMIAEMELLQKEQAALARARAALEALRQHYVEEKGEKGTVIFTPRQIAARPAGDTDPLQT
jgi:hypothetical protein